MFLGVIRAASFRVFVGSKCAALMSGSNRSEETAGQSRSGTREWNEGGIKKTAVNETNRFRNGIPAQTGLSALHKKASRLGGAGSCENCDNERDYFLSVVAAGLGSSLVSAPAGAVAFISLMTASVRSLLASE